MLGTFIAAFVVFGAAIMGMAIGVMASNRCLKGSCGGLSNMISESDGSSSGSSGCGVCGATSPEQPVPESCDSSAKDG